MGISFIAYIFLERGLNWSTATTTATTATTAITAATTAAATLATAATTTTALEAFPLKKCLSHAAVIVVAEQTFETSVFRSMGGVDI